MSNGFDVVGIDDLYDEYRVMEVVADIFLECLGVRMQHRMGPTGFRNFTRYQSIPGLFTVVNNIPTTTVILIVQLLVFQCY